MDIPGQSTRREFLQGRAAADAVLEAVDGIVPADEPARPGEGGYLLRIARRAMACQFEFFFNAGQYPHDTEAAVAALDLVDALETQLSVFRPDSEISRLNRRAASEAIQLEPALFAVIATAMQLHHETAGAYDVTSGALSNVWGFTRRNGQIPSAEALAAALEQVGSQHLDIDASAMTIRFRRSGVEINLGSIGKGYALDRAAELLTAAGIDDFLLHGGHSSVLSRGAHGQRTRDDGWSIGLRDPLHPARRLGSLRLCNRALATSGSGTQFFMHEGRRFGHLLDPRSGWPAEGMLSATVLAPTAAHADALSTAFYVMGPLQAQTYCETHPEIAAVLICPGRRAGSVERHTFGLEPRDWIENEAE